MIMVEVQDLDGIPIEGLTLENSNEIIGNEIEKIVRWKGNPNLGEINNQPVKLRFFLKDADLYSLKFE
jgi:hypothetical protein